jgi:hypothetical protein
MNRNLLFRLALLILPTAGFAITSSAATFSGPPSKFVGLNFSNPAYVTFDLGAGGKFTGVVEVPQGPRTVIRGTLDVTGSYSGTTDTGKAPFFVVVSGSTPSTYGLSGSAAGRGFEGVPFAYSKGQTAVETGTYTSYIQTSATSASIPESYGYATLTVAKTGAARLRGKMPDGTSFTAASNILTQGTSAHYLILYDGNLYNRKGYFLDVIPDIVPADFTGELIWMKMPDKSPYYPAGFTAVGGNTGYRYTRMPLPFTSGSGEIVIVEGGLATTSTGAFTLSPTGKIIVTPPNSINFKATIDDATGAAKGSFDYPHMAGGRTVDSKVRFGGLLLETGTNTSVVIGNFLSPVTSGSGSAGVVEFGE